MAFRKAETLQEGAAQELFAEKLGEFLTWLKARGWKARLSECGVQSARTFIHDGVRMKGVDSVHRVEPASLHYLRRAIDVNLIVPGKGWIREGGTPEWAEAHEVWAALHPNCRFGNGVGSDDNHLSLVANDKERW
jgi:hypothetical protein